MIGFVRGCGSPLGEADALFCLDSVLSGAGITFSFQCSLKTRTLNLQLSELASTTLHLSGDVTQAPWWLENRQVGSDVFFVKTAQLPL